MSARNKAAHDARTYWDFIHKTIVNNELFAWLSFEATVFWEVLMFSDISNYGGIQVNEQGAHFASFWHANALTLCMQAPNPSL